MEKIAKPAKPKAKVASKTKAVPKSKNTVKTNSNTKTPYKRK